MSLISDGYTLLGTLKIPSVTGSESNVPLIIKYEDFTVGMLADLESGGGGLALSGDSGGAERLPLEIVRFTKSAGDAVWFPAPTAATDELIYVWNKVGASQPAVDAAFGRNAVWSGFDLVIHQGSIVDSSGNHTPSLVGAPSLSDMMWGGQGYNLNTAGKYVRIPHSASLNLGRDYSLDLWMNNVIASGTTYVDKVNVGNSQGFRFLSAANNVFRTRHPNLTSSNLDAADAINGIQRLSSNFDDTTRKNILNGVTVTSDTPTGTVTNSTEDLYIGNSLATPTDKFNGVLGEFWLAIPARTTNRGIEQDNQSAAGAWFIATDVVVGTQNVDMNLASTTPVVYSPKVVTAQEIETLTVSGTASVYDFDVSSEQFIDFEIASGTTTVYLMEVLSGVTEIEMELTSATASVLSPEILAGVVEVFPTLITSVANVYMLRLEYLQYIDAITVEAETEVFLPGQEPVSPGRAPVVVIQGQQTATSGGTVSLVAYVLNSVSTANYTFVWSVESGEGLLTKLTGQHTSVILPLMDTTNNVTVRCVAILGALELTTVHLITTASGDTTMATKPNLRLLQSTSWISLNTVTSIAVGTAFTVRNNGQVPLKYFEGVAAPTDVSSYEVLYPPYFGVLSILQVSTGADEIFVLNDSSVEVNLSINS